MGQQRLGHPARDRSWQRARRRGGLRVVLSLVLLAGPAVGAAARADPAPPPPPPPPLTLGELLDMSVSVSSTRDERVSHAAASITAYADEDLKALGVYTLFDLANITAGYSGTVMYGEKVLETRGQKAGSFNNNKHLVYFDGIPINHARNFKAPIDEEFPLFSARRVELLRGSASALYGTGAFFGAINVLPKELSGNGMQVETRFSLGSRDSEWRVGSNALYADEERSVRLSFGYYDKGASRAPVGINNDPRNVYWDDQSSIFLNGSYALRTSPLAGASLGFLYMRRNGGLGESWNESGWTHEVNDLTWETIIPYLKYTRDLGKRVSLRGYLMANSGREAGVFAPLDPVVRGYDGQGSVLEVYQAQVDAGQGKAEVAVSLGPGSDLVAGVTVDTRRERGADRSHDYMISADPGPPYQGDPAFAAPSARHTIYSAYFQLQQELPVLAGLSLTLGAREDHGATPQPFSELSPRLGLVQRLSEGFTVKAFFGTALRAPGIKEIGLNQEAREEFARTGQVIDRDLTLRAETIRSLEVGPSYIGSRFSAALTLFSNRTIDALDGFQYRTLNIFVNGEGEADAHGFEAELRVAPTRRLRLFANHSWARARDPAGHDVEDVPTRHATLGAVYQAPSPWGRLTLGGAARWVQGFRVAAGKDSREEAVWADVNLVWSFSRWLDLELQARNVLGTSTKLPKHGVPDVPQPGFRLLGTLACGF
jgi:outer membrane receptor for ferrienterochelin and colicins